MWVDDARTKEVPGPKDGIFVTLKAKSLGAARPGEAVVGVVKMLQLHVQTRQAARAPS